MYSYTDGHTNPITNQASQPISIKTSKDVQTYQSQQTGCVQIGITQSNLRLFSNERPALFSSLPCPPSLSGRSPVVWRRLLLRLTVDFRIPKKPLQLLAPQKQRWTVGAVAVLTGLSSPAIRLDLPPVSGTAVRMLEVGAISLKFYTNDKHICQQRKKKAQAPPKSRTFINKRCRQT